jgi:hypothetical protein
VVSRDPIWRAGSDGVGHALETPRSLRTACGERPVEERLAWPITERCGDCLAITGITVTARVAPETELELREAWGK